MTRITAFGRSAVRTVIEKVGRGFGRYQERRPVSYDLLESDEEYLVVFDAPGAEPDDVRVQLADRTVEVRVDRFREYREGFEMTFPGRGLTLKGSAELPKDSTVTPAGARATLSDSGTLRVHVRKDRRSRNVQVEEESDAGPGNAGAGGERREDGTDAGDDGATRSPIAGARMNPWPCQPTAT